MDFTSELSRLQACGVPEASGPESCVVVLDCKIQKSFSFNATDVLKPQTPTQATDPSSMPWGLA